jgi:hypothetical protein
MKIKRGRRGSRCLGRRNSTGRQFKLGLLLVGTAALMNPAFSAGTLALETNKGAAITVLVFNFRQAPAQTLTKAEKEAGRILEQVDVPVTWRDCSTGNEPCRKGPGRVFVLAMMAGPVQNKFADTISGYAVLPTHLAAVYPAIRFDRRSMSVIEILRQCHVADPVSGHNLKNDAAVTPGAKRPTADGGAIQVSGRVEKQSSCGKIAVIGIAKPVQHPLRPLALRTRL